MTPEEQIAELMAGIKTIVREPNLRTLVGLYAAQTLVAGALNVLVVVTAFELLDLDDAGMGLLYAAVGVGGLVGGFVALILSAHGRLARDFALGLALFGLPLILVGGVPVSFVAVAALGVIGIGNSIVDVNALTIMVPPLAPSLSAACPQRGPGLPGRMNRPPAASVEGFLHGDHSTWRNPCA